MGLEGRRGRLVGRLGHLMAAWAAIALAGFADAVVAQARGTPGPMDKVGCLRGRPAPHCRSFWVVEMQGSTPLWQTARTTTFDGGSMVRRDAVGSQLEWNLGHMVNLGDSWALGGLLSAGSGNTDPLTGLKLRVRRWISPDVSVELEGGLLRSNAADTQFPGLNGGTADVRLVIRDQGSFFVRWDVLPLPEKRFRFNGFFDPGGTQHGISVGAGLGSVPALVGTGALGLAYVVAIAIFVAGEAGT